MWVVSDIVIPEGRDSSPVSNDDRPERWKPPDNQIPVTVPFPIVLARTAELAVFVQDARVYLTAVDLRLTVLFRTTQNEPLPRHPRFDPAPSSAWSTPTGAAQCSDCRYPCRHLRSLALMNLRCS